MVSRTKKLVLSAAALLLAMAVLVALLFYFKVIKLNTPSREEYPVWGVDVSEYQGDIDWQLLQTQGVQFAFVKATEGSSYVDPCFATNWAALQETNILFGAYHFFSFDSPAATQAASFVKTVDNCVDMIVPVIDVELYGRHKANPPDADAVRGELAQFVETIRAHYGCYPILYATGQAYERYISGHFSQCPIWIRDVYLWPSLGDDREWTFWQYSDTGRLEGYHGEEKHIDMNVYHSSRNDLEALLLTSAN